MPRFFIDSPPCNSFSVTGGDAVHISRSLRMKTGDGITFCNNGSDYRCTITAITAERVECRVDEVLPTRSEPSVCLTIYQAMPKADKLELIIQKTVELGASRIVPFISKRCVSLPDAERFEKKRERLSKISLEAAKQAGRGIVPEIAPLMSMEQALEDMSACDIRLICYENGGAPLSGMGIDSSRSVGVMIGSEGGFERGEVEYAQSKGAKAVWLGERILRCETCPIAVTAIIMSLSGNM